MTKFKTGSTNGVNFRTSLKKDLFLPDFSPWLRDKIWVGPGDEAMVIYMYVHVGIVNKISYSCSEHLASSWNVMRQK